MKRTSIKPVSPKQMAELKRRSVLKEELIMKYGERCMSCGGLPDWRGLSLHHKKFLSHIGNTTEENCQILCGKCHDLRHHIFDK